MPDEPATDLHFLGQGFPRKGVREALAVDRAMHGSMPSRPVTLAELIAASQAKGRATPEHAERLGIPAHSVEWMSTAPLVTQGTPWRPTAEIGAKLAAWLGEPLHVVLAAVLESHKETTRA